MHRKHVLVFIYYITYTKIESVLILVSEVLIIYELTDKHIWQGRIDDDSESLRYHQTVKIKSIDTLKKQTKNSFSLIGFQCDEGVRRNLGRTGAAKGPEAIRPK